jgi:hypothetical protein
MRSVLLSALVLPLLLVACRKEESAELPEDTYIYQDYKVLFDKPENRTRAFATFRKNSSLGVRLELTGGSSIRFNNENWTSYTELDNYFYRWTDEGMVDVEFSFTNAGIGVFTNSITRADTFDVQIPTGVVLSRTNGGQVFWVGRPLVAGETMKAQVKQSGVNSSTSTVQTTGAASIQLSADQLSSLSAGTADLYLTRTRTLGLQQSDGGAGGRRIVEVEARGTVTLE